MGRFVLGLIIGLVVGVLAMTYNPDLPQEVRTGLTELAALGARHGTGRRGRGRRSRRGGGAGRGSGARKTGPGNRAG